MSDISCCWRACQSNKNGKCFLENVILSAEDEVRIKGSDEKDFYLECINFKFGSNNEKSNIINKLIYCGWTRCKFNECKLNQNLGRCKCNDIELISANTNDSQEEYLICNKFFKG